MDVIEGLASRAYEAHAAHDSVYWERVFGVKLPTPVPFGGLAAYVRESHGAIVRAVVNEVRPDIEALIRLAGEEGVPDGPAGRMTAPAAPCEGE